MIKTIIMMLLRRGVGGIVAIFISSLIARNLGIEEFGKYTFVINFILLVCSFGILGVDSSITFYLSKKNNLQNTFISVGLSFMLLVSFLVSLIIYFASYFFVGSYAILFEFKSIIFCCIFFTLISSVFLSIYSGLLKFNHYAFLSLTPNVFFIIYIGAIKVFKISSTIENLLIGYTFGYVLGGILLFVFLKRPIRQLKRMFRFKRHVLVSLLKFGFKSYLSNVVTFLNNRINLFIIAYFASDQLLSLYSSTLPFVEAIWIVSYAIVAVSFPLLAQSSFHLHRTKIIPILTWIVLVLTLLIGSLIWGVGPVLFSYLYGDNFTEAFKLLMIVMPGVVLWSGARVILTDFASYGLPEINIYVNVATLPVSILLNIFLVSKYSIEGAAYATLISYILFSVISVYIYKRMFKVSFLKFIFPRLNDFKLVLSLINNKKLLTN